LDVSPRPDAADILTYADIAIKIAILRYVRRRSDQVLPEPEAGVQSIGATIRAARIARGLTQQRAAKAANVSRAQLALLEQGGNVSIKFLLKISRYLELTTIPLDGTVRLTSGAREGVKLFDLIQSLDLLAALVDRLRDFAMQAVLPPSERGKLDDTLALREFVAKHLGDDVGVQRLAKAVAGLSDDVPAGATPPRITEDAAVTARRERRTRRHSQ
jgi:transcriptional regulator with XRE-family HTH domain